MSKRFICFVLGILMYANAVALNTQVFVSFSMPEQLLKQTLSEAAQLHIPAILNGLIDNSMPKTIEKIAVISNAVPNLTLQIDPTAFERFGIKQVPAIVVNTGESFDVIYGNLSLKEGLLRIAGHGDSGLLPKDVRRIIGA